MSQQNHKPKLPERKATNRVTATLYDDGFTRVEWEMLQPKGQKIPVSIPQWHKMIRFIQVAHKTHLNNWRKLKYGRQAPPTAVEVAAAQAEPQTPPSPEPAATEQELQTA